MSEMVDDDLIGGDELDDIYDITNEREEALLQDDEEYSKGRELYDRKKESSFSDEEHDDVLNLDIEEDFQDDDKTLYEDDEEDERCKKGDRKFSVENKQVSKQNSTGVTKVPTATKLVPVAQKTNNVSQNVTTVKKTFMKNNKWKRGNEKGNYQPRQRFNKNNMQRRRNGTVLINPRYEGTVHLNENSARLAWDTSNTQYVQNNANLVHPWGSGNVIGNSNASSVLMTNLVTGIASLAQQPGNILLPQTQLPAQNFYQPPPSNYEPQLSFEPPPNIAEAQPPQQPFRNHNLQHTPEWSNPHIPQNQVTHQQNMPPPQQSYYREPQQHFNSQTSRIQGNSYFNYESFNRPMTQQNYPSTPQRNLNLTNSYENKSLNYNRPVNKFTHNNTFLPQSNFQNKNGNSNYQNRDSNFSSNVMKQTSYNYSPATYENSTFNKSDFNQRNENINYRTDFYQNKNFNTTNKFQNQPQQRVQFRKDFNGSNNTVPQRSNYVQNKNYARLGNVRPIPKETSEIHDHSPEKRPKINEKPNTQIEDESYVVKNEEKAQQTNNKNEEEDEETRLYRLKIEEQKRERERILRIKEERRKQMILQRQKQDEDKLVIPVPQKQEPSAMQKYQLSKPPQFTKKITNFENLPATVSTEKPNQSGVVQRSNQYHPTSFQTQTQSQAFSSTSLGQQQTQNFDDSPDPSAELYNLTFKVSNNLQTAAPAVKDPPKTEATCSSFMSNRVVVVKSKNNQKSGTVASSDVTVTKPVSTEIKSEPSDVGQGLSSFFNNRKVLKKDNNLLNTKLVVVNNLSATINQNKLMALSRGIGEIQTLRVDKQERQATILFKSVASAHAFFKKYQRRILDDLSVIEVKLEPML